MSKLKTEVTESLSSRILREIYEDLDRFHHKTKRTKREIIETALRKEMKLTNQPKEK